MSISSIAWTLLMLHDTPAFTLKNEKLDTLASCNCTEDSPLHEFLSVAFSLIMIMLQANSLG